MGGLVEAKPFPLIVDRNSEQGIYLCSDFHLGAAQTDYGLIKRELDRACSQRDRILIGGDIFDAILPRDGRRFAPSTNIPSLAVRDDMATAAVEWAYHFLEPYMGYIDGFGVGNHETAILKKNNADLIRQLWGLFYADGSDAEFLGYTSLIHYDVKDSITSRKRDSFDIWFSHGSGSVASEAAALNRLKRQSLDFDADVYWSGHYHVKVVSAGERITSRGPKNVHHILTGGYQNPYQPQSQEDVRLNGWKNNYASEAGLRPQGRGGVRVVLEIGDKGRIERVRTEQ